MCQYYRSQFCQLYTVLYQRSYQAELVSFECTSGYTERHFIHIIFSPNFSVLFEAIRSADIPNGWKTRPEQIETASIRLRSILISFVEHIDKTNADDLVQYFNSLGPFLVTQSAVTRDLNVKEDLSEFGRLRTAINKHLMESCESTLTSIQFRRAACAYGKY